VDERRTEFWRADRRFHRLLERGDVRNIIETNLDAAHSSPAIDVVAQNGCSVTANVAGGQYAVGSELVLGRGRLRLKWAASTVGGLNRAGPSAGIVLCVVRRAVQRGLSPES
jgi:hypothetical protein